jgi:hypothetical protein
MTFAVVSSQNPSNAQNKYIICFIHIRQSFDAFRALKALLILLYAQIFNLHEENYAQSALISGLSLAVLLF